MDAIEAQHAQGRLTARERLELLFDSNVFEEIAPAGSDAAIIVAQGTVHGRKVFAHASDDTLNGGVLSADDLVKIADLQAWAVAERAPIIGLFDARGVADDIGVVPMLAEIYRRSAEARTIIPQIALVMGTCIGPQAILASLNDLIFMVGGSALFVTGPDVVNALTHEDLSDAELGGATLHAQTSGLADAVYDNDLDAILALRRCLAFVSKERSAESFDDPARVAPALDSLVPDDRTRAYDVKELIHKTLDEREFFELERDYARNLIVGFGRLDGRPVGIIANQPLVLAGVLDAAALSKATRFIDLCGRFAIPLVTFVDAPGFLPGVAQEAVGIAHAGADLVAAYAQARVPKVAVVLRNAPGPVPAMLASTALGAIAVYAWPSARIFSNNAQTHDLNALQTQGLIDAVIKPQETRRHLIDALKRATAAD